MGLEIEGRIQEIFDLQQVNDTFQKQEFVIETDEKYPQLIKFELTQLRCDLIGSYQEGDKIKVEFNLKGREWNGKYFTNLHAWRITGLDVKTREQPDVNQPEQPLDEATDNDLPF